jgi:sugar/nucleoside kinase (ribokinase family)
MSHENVILVIGACGMDRLLSVSHYPTPDAKVRTTVYHEVGGGNAANTATAMARLSRAAIFRESFYRIQLCTKVGDDYVGRQIMADLEAEGVDLSSPLFRVGNEGSTTAFTTIVVSEEEHTRTCIHTPGTCGELTLDDLQQVDRNDLFQNVVLLHTDARHTDVALALAREAQKRGIPVSLDVEKDRNSKALDALLDVASIVLTNADQLEDYLTKLTREMEDSRERSPLMPTSVCHDDKIEEADAKLLAHLIRPSAFFTRWYNQIGKEIVITRGSQGSALIRCDSIQIKEENKQIMPVNEVSVSVFDNGVMRASVKQVFSDVNDEKEDVLCTARYHLETAGILSNAEIVDTTGAGDAFFGAFLLAKLHSELKHKPRLALSFASWVAGRKLGGPGARTAIPRAHEVDEELGEDIEQMQRSLQLCVGGFRFDSRRTMNAP